MEEPKYLYYPIFEQIQSNIDQYVINKAQWEPSYKLFNYIVSFDAFLAIEHYILLEELYKGPFTE